MFFSVIVPIYNIEKYIKRCIESVLAQNFTDYELILVDDGSPDNCGAICDEYARVDDRIKVIHKVNGGLVSARQAGIQVAKGDYVFNLDGDDAMHEDALQNAYDILSKTKADIATFSIKYCYDDKDSEVFDDLMEEGLYDKAKMETHIYPKLLSDENMHHIFYFLCGKAIKRELLTGHQLRVNPAISLGEDLSCIVPCYLEAQSVYVSRAVSYLYMIRSDSISTDFKTAQITQVADVVKGLKEISLPVPADFEMQIARYSCFMCFAILAAAAEGKHFKALPKLEELIMSTVHKDEIPKASFTSLTTKSRIAISLMQKRKFKSAFYFLYLCKQIKCLMKKG